jgi:hypothetical protein
MSLSSLTLLHSQSFVLNNCKKNWTLSVSYRNWRFATKFLANYSNLLTANTFLAVTVWPYRISAQPFSTTHWFFLFFSFWISRFEIKANCGCSCSVSPNNTDLVSSGFGYKNRTEFKAWNSETNSIYIYSISWTF